ncbi:MAG: metalloregulator ArsR/SmtB family transcription factor [Verrucomicrobia bacterium]|jgi:DNA-binding transcriptional ArsR family regulator|nr:metalloregulator ArsR/SmtB family transcription factor [Verrucomicrobiota bacterium]
MAFQKSTLFSPEHAALAKFAHALSHPARIALIKILQNKGEACCGELVAALPLAQATISQHLRCLREVGLLEQRNCGPKICYSLNCEAMRDFCHSFQCTLGTDTANEPVEVAQS